jgi:hypothetical protein
MKAGFSREGRILVLDMFVISDNGPNDAQGDAATSGRIVYLQHATSAFLKEALQRGAEQFRWQERVARTPKRIGTKVRGVGVSLSCYVGGTVRSLNVPGRVKQHLQIKPRQRGLDEAAYVKSFLVLNALGGDCLEDFERLREDEGLSEMLGHEVPSPEAARKFLYQFHDETKLEEAQKELPVGQVSYIAEESALLRALAQVNQEMVQEVGRRCPGKKIATIDLDATIIESYKREAQPTYQGGSGYQPMLTLWAEMNLALAEEFRDGNVQA